MMKMMTRKLIMTKRRPPWRFDGNSPVSDGYQADSNKSMKGAPDKGLNKKDNCVLTNTNISISGDISNTSNENSSHISSQLSPRHHRGRISSPQSSHIAQDHPFSSQENLILEDMNFEDRKLAQL